VPKNKNIGEISQGGLIMDTNFNINYKRELPTPEELKNKIPIDLKLKQKKIARDKEIADVIRGQSNKLLMIIGPCSADRIDAVLEYANKLALVQEQVKDKIIIIMRVYTCKPRTTGIGYKGLLYHPDPSKAPDILKGLIAMREIHKQVLEESGLCCADEMLYPENYRYLSDLLSYVAVGARSVEDQGHRFVASGINIPVGMKNPTSGDFSVMLNSIRAAQSQHTFLYCGWEVESAGNEMAHAVLRGGVDKYGKNHANYHYEDLVLLYEMYCNKNYKYPAVIIDANHSNSGKNYLEQPRVINNVLGSMSYNNNIKQMIKGFMVESYLEDGCQKIEDGIYGKSITDPCLGWEKTERLIFSVAEKL